MPNNKIRKMIKPKYYDHDYRFMRAIKFFYQADDDVFFYGIHRSKPLKECTYKKFWFPNHNNILRWCYPYIFQLILKGKVIITNNERAIWHNKAYTYKYSVPDLTHQNKYYTYLTNGIKRINIYYMYSEQIIKKNYFFY